MPAPFADFAALCEALGRTSSRLERARRVADYLRELSPEDAEVASRLLLGRTSPKSEGRRLFLGGAAVWEAARAAGAEALAYGGDAVDFGDVIERAMSARIVDQAAAQPAPLGLDDVRGAFAAIAEAGGSGSRARRLELLAALFRRATPLEAKYLAKIVVGEMRHGVQEGILLDAAAAIAGVTAAVTAAEARRAQQSLGDVGSLVRQAKTDPARLRGAAVELLRPIEPMLAQSAADVAAAMQRCDGKLALELKLDGARVQIHRRGDEIRIFSRRLQDVTRSLPDVVDEVRRRAGGGDVVFEGEVIALADGRPLPFQELMRRFRRVRDIEAVAREVPVRLYLFDLLYGGGGALLDEPYEARSQALERQRGELERVTRLLPCDLAEAEGFYRDAIAAGHEGAMAKALDSRYTPGIRGAAWLKIKHSVTLDLVVVAADWGYGRRHGWLSNYHLAARDPAGGGFAEVGKTFKGPTDAEFKAITERLLALRLTESDGTVHVRPEIVVEVRFDGIQKSPQYACGMALRFARIVRVRDDKTPAEADTVETLRRLFAAEASR
jgi:DNA ligase-1